MTRVPFTAQSTTSNLEYPQRIRYTNRSRQSQRNVHSRDADIGEPAFFLEEGTLEPLPPAAKSAAASANPEGSFDHSQY